MDATNHVPVPLPMIKQQNKLVKIILYYITHKEGEGDGLSVFLLLSIVSLTKASLHLIYQLSILLPIQNKMNRKKKVLYAPEVYFSSTLLQHF